VRAEPQQVVQEPRDLVEHHPDVLRAKGRLDAKEPFYCHHVGMLVRHHRHVVEAVHVRHGLHEGPGLNQLFRRAVQQADMRIGALDHFAVELEHEPQHPVRRGVLRPEIHGVVTQLRHRISPTKHRGHRG
jgi:hypothetical protein